VIDKIDYVASWADRLESRLMDQYQGKPNLVAFARNVCAPQFQDLEEAFQSLRTMPSIEDGVGFELDIIGRVLKQLRLGNDDPTYRLYLRTRDRANHSDGSVPALYGVLHALLGQAASFTYTPGRLASFEMRINTPVSTAVATVAASFLGDAKSDGVRGILEWQEDVDAETFYTARCATLDSDAGGGAVLLHTPDTSMLPLSGSIELDHGLTNAETVTYMTAGPNLLHVSACAHAHAAGASAEFVGDLGLGFGDSSDASVGGKFAGATGA